MLGRLIVFSIHAGRSPKQYMTIYVCCFMFLFEEVAEQKRLVINSARNTAMKQFQKTFSIKPVFPCFFLSKSEVVCISFCKTADHPSKLFGHSVSLHSPCQAVLAGKGFVSEKLDDVMPHIKSIESIHIWLRLKM